MTDAIGILGTLKDTVPAGVWALLGVGIGVYALFVAWEAFVAGSLFAPLLAAVGVALFVIVALSLRREIGEDRDR